MDTAHTYFAFLHCTISFYSICVCLLSTGRKVFIVKLNDLSKHSKWKIVTGEREENG